MQDLSLARCYPKCKSNKVLGMKKGEINREGEFFI